MKRTPLGPGRASIERGSTFGPSRGKPKRRASVIDRIAQEAWAKRARSKPCAICGAEHAKGHHVITQQQLRNTASEQGLDFDRLRWDRRNLLPLCDRHHNAHHNRSRPVPWSVLERDCPKVFQFARELDLLWWLERTYSIPEERAA